MSFVHLHNHSHYSLLDGLGAPKHFLEKAKELGMTAFALTDNGAVYGAIEFYKAAKKLDIKPIIGATVYVTDDYEAPDLVYELVLLAENQEGYGNLLSLLTQAHMEHGQSGRPLADHALLEKYAKGLIALSGGINGEVAQKCLHDGVDQGEATVKRYQGIYGQEGFFLEIQKRPEIIEYTGVFQNIVALSKKTGAGLVATNDCRYVTKDRSQAHDILVCIGAGATVHSIDRKRYDGDYSLKSPEEMKEMFADLPEAIENTVKIADRCNVEFEFGGYLFPQYECPDGFDAESYLRHLCQEGLKQRYGDPVPKEAQERLDYELNLVHTMGFDAYFLIVQDFVNYAKDQGIIVGPGRGSAAGSIIAYTLKITELDPIKYGLIFERFLNPERISMPDIDIDFQDDRREEVLDYVIEKYGREAVSQVITFGTMAAKAAIRDVGRALGYPYTEVDRIAKLVPPAVLGKYAPLQESINEDPELGAVYKNEPRTKVLLDNAVLLEGTVRNVGTHACAVMIADRSLTSYTVLQRPAGQDEGMVTQFSMGPLEDLGLLKMDFLGLKNLTIMRNTVDLIDKRHGVKVDLGNIPLGDEGAFKLLQRGDTTGVFQLESAGMRRYLKELRPTELADIIAMNALYRPGPMQYIPQYIKGKHDPKSVKYIDPSFEGLLSETYGVAVYQEQILKIAQQFSGFSLGQADILRKAVGKKIPALLAEQRVKFVDGAIEQGHSKKFAQKVFDEVVEPFAGYGFNKAHAACYGYIAYLTAYLKSHYPAEFMATLMTADQDNTEKVVFEIEEARTSGLEVLPPAINESFTDFTVVDESTIRFGLGAIKGVGASTVSEIIAIREKDGKFENLEDFTKRVPYKLLNKKVIEALAYSGSLDEMADRRAIAESYEDIADFAKSFQGKNDQNQTDIFASMDASEMDAFRLKDVTPTSFLEQLNYEKEYLGLFVSGHPLQGLSKYLRGKITLVKSMTRKMCDKNIDVGGLITLARRITTKKGDYMMYMTIEDPTGRIEVVIFTKTYNEFSPILQEGNTVFVSGKLDWRRDKFQVRARSIKKVSLERMIQNAKERGNYDPNERVKMHEHNGAEEPKPEVEVAPEGVEAPAEAVVVQPFIIRVPKTAQLSSLEEVKQLLLKAKGDRPTEIHIEKNDQVKRIKVPFGVLVTDELKAGISKILNC